MYLREKSNADKWFMEVVYYQRDHIVNSIFIKNKMEMNINESKTK